MWVITAAAYNNQTASVTYTFTTSDWASVASGSTTVDTTSKIAFKLYLRNNTTAPAMPTGVSYNFSTQTWTLPANWSTTPQGWVDTAQNLWVVYGTIVTTSTSGTPTYGVTTPRRGEFTSWYLEANSSVSNTMGVPRMYALWSGLAGPITHTRGIFSRILPFSGRGQELRLRANMFNQSNQVLNLQVQFYDSAFNILHSITVSAAASSTYSVQTAISLIPSNLNISSYRFVISNGGGTGLSGAMSISDIKLDTAAGAELIVDGAITTDKIQANAINADKIQANSISTSKLVIGDMSILNRNSSFEEGDTQWTKDSPWAIVNDPANARTGSFVAQSVGTAFAALRSSTVVPTNPGEAFTCDGWLKTSASNINDCWVRIVGLNSSGAEVWTSNGNVLVGPTTTYTRSVGTFVVPAGVVGVRVEAVASSTGGTVWVDNLRMFRANTGELIVDGAITANKIFTGAITTDKIDAGAITAAKLATTELITVSAQIKDAIITTAKIGDLQVETLKIAGNAVTAPYAASTSSALFLPSAADSITDILSLSVTPSNIASVYLSLSADMANTHASYSYLAQFQITINGSLVFTSENILLSPQGISGNTGFWSHSGIFPVSVGVSNTIILRVKTIGFYANTQVRVTNRSVFALELKR